MAAKFPWIFKAIAPLVLVGALLSVVGLPWPGVVRRNASDHQKPCVQRDAVGRSATDKCCDGLKAVANEGKLFCLPIKK